MSNDAASTRNGMKGRLEIIEAEHLGEQTLLVHWNDGPSLRFLSASWRRCIRSLREGENAEVGEESL
jgi:hypothetical protein